MTVYPFAIDSDSDIIRVDDNVTEVGGQAINQLRDAVFALEEEIGITPSGSRATLAERIDVSLNQDGSIKSSALTSVGLAALPIDNSDVGTGAGIDEFKLNLDHSTSDLFTLISSNSALLTSLNSFATNTRSDLDTHIGGGAVLADGSPGRHVASHIDLNDTPSDIRDPVFSWTGLLDKDGNARSATHVASALLEINDDFTSHQNATSGAHVASAVSINVDNFETIPTSIDDVQQFVDYVDDFDAVTVREHRAVQHANAVPTIARSQGLELPDGYGWQNVVPPTTASTFLVRSPNTMPVDDISTGDDVVSFSPDNTGFVFDSQFVRVKVGDIIRINYANGMEAAFPVESIKFVPGSTWAVRLNGVNLADSDVALARIDRPNADRDTAGVLAVASANATPTGSFDSILQSAIVGHPRGATALGLGFDPNQLDATHYKLYLELYPSGNPSEHSIELPAIDVTGDAGASVGSYTLEKVVRATNNNLREIGFNYRFIAFSKDGEFGLMLADPVGNASFAIISGSNSSGTLIEGTFTENVIGDAAGDGFDALGLGQTHADIASPLFISSFTDSTAALLPTKVIAPRKFRHYMVDGVKKDGFAPTWQANADGYWDGYITARNVIGAFTVETTYAVELDLKAAGLKPGKTIVVQPAVSFSDPLYNDVDYGRFIIKSVSFAGVCPGESALTLITVINGIHALGSGVGASGSPNLDVRLYFGEDSVSFNNQNVIDTTLTSQDYHRLHEIFVSNEGKTFSHERARMPVQSQTGELLDTVNWHVEDVSPKLRGYRDDATSFNKFVRFYILSYNSSTGEFDGYIGKRSPTTANISSVGPITTGRKNVPTRFYDETNVDFIELTFTETAAVSPGNSIITTPASRYVDIELFPSLQLDDEMLLLATAEVNWDPQSNQNVVQRVKDRREFGSIDEEDFTDSAIEFISAGDRFLHDNGVLRGLGFDFVNPDDNREIFYKGGTALVNGSIVTVNAISVTIPELIEDGTSPPTTVDWAVCVNESGALEPIIITSSKQQFFAQDNVSSGTYYVPSVTFTELVETRKDLTPIAVVTSNIASVTINDSDVLDVRRFIDDGKKRELVYSPSDFAGTFHTADALINWVNRYGSSNPLACKVRGDFDVDSSIDFTGLTNPVILEGDGATFNVTVEQGILINSNISFKNIDFNYDPVFTTSFLANDKINTFGGCIYHGSGSNVQDVTIENCTFTSTETRQRPPFVSINMELDDVVERLNVVNNKFNDANVDPAEDQAAIALVSSNSGAGSGPALVINSNLSGNVCNNHQGIYITQERTSGSPGVAIPGVSIVNTNVSSNFCGVVGFIASSQESSYALDTRTDRSQGLKINGNTCHIIGNIANGDASEPGTFILTSVDTNVPSGNIEISGNTCHWIWLISGQEDSATEYSQTIVSNNRLTAFDLSFFNQYETSASSISQAIAIIGSTNLEASEAIISNNIINFGLFDSTIYLYDRGIAVITSANITNNIIRGLETAAIGILADEGGFGPSNLNYVITGNKIYRQDTVTTRDITNYIALSSLSTTSGIVVGNFFDDTTVDGGDDEVITGSGTSPSGTRSGEFIVERNKNQTESIAVDGSSGHFTLNNIYTDYASTLTSTITNQNLDTNLIAFTNNDNPSSVAFRWLVGGVDILPPNVLVTSISITHIRTGGAASTNDLTITIDDRDGASETSSTFNPAVSVENTDTFNISGTYRNTFSNRLNVLVQYVSDDDTLTLRDLSITFRW